MSRTCTLTSVGDCQRWLASKYLRSLLILGFSQEAKRRWYEECVRAFPDRDHFWLPFFHCDNSVIECMYVRRAELLALRNFLDGLSVMIKAFSQLSKAHKMELRAKAKRFSFSNYFFEGKIWQPEKKEVTNWYYLFCISWICAKKFKTFS